MYKVYKVIFHMADGSHCEYKNLSDVPMPGYDVKDLAEKTLSNIKQHAVLAVETNTYDNCATVLTIDTSQILGATVRFEEAESNG